MSVFGLIASQSSADLVAALSENLHSLFKLQKKHVHTVGIFENAQKYRRKDKK